MRTEELIIKECGDLAEIREKILSARQHCQSYAAEITAPSAPSIEPGITKKQNLDFVLIQLDRVLKYLLQLETTYLSLANDLADERASSHLGENAQSSARVSSSLGAASLQRFSEGVLAH